MQSNKSEYMVTSFCLHLNHALSFIYSVRSRNLQNAVFFSLNSPSIEGIINVSIKFESTFTVNVMCSYKKISQCVIICINHKNPIVG